MKESLFEKLESWPCIACSAFLVAASLVGEWCPDCAFLIPAAWGAVLLCGLPLAWEAMEVLFAERRITSALLVTTAIVAALLIGEDFAAGEVALIMAIGEKLESGTVSRARRGLQQLVALAPAQARRLTSGGEEMVSAEELRPGDVLRVKPGESIPADGRLVSGNSTVNQAQLTGESLPLDRGVGEPVYAGSINGEGSFDMVVECAAGDSALQRLIDMMQQAAQHRAPIQKEADRWAEILVPVSLLTAVLGFGVMKLLGMETQDALLRALTVLVVFCPCALVLATPAALMAAIGHAARRGVIIKNGEALEGLARVTTIAFDKTGTLTEGRIRLAGVSSFAPDDVLRLCAAVERRSEHPLAQAVVAAAPAELPEVADFRMQAGRGVSGVVEGRLLHCGSERWMQELGIRLSAEQSDCLAGYRAQGMATILLADENRCLGILALSDALRPEAAEVVQALADVHTVLLSGDHPAAAASQCRALGLSELCAGLMPEQKAAYVQEAQARGERVAMVGDGVNDAPALKAAQVGISMSRFGSDIATEAADVALMRDDLRLLPYLLRLSRATLRTIRRGITAAMLINLAAVTAGLLGLLGPAVGALVHNLGSLVVIAYAATLHERR